MRLFWFSKSAELGSISAIFNLGVCFYNGEGVPRNALMAEKFFRKAAALGSVEAKAFLKELGKE